MNIKTTLTKTPAQKPDQSKLGFGKIFTDHMLTIAYDKGIGWHDAEIKPVEPFQLHPATCSLHYAQLIFEGLKVYNGEGGKKLLFRAKDNFRRLNTSAERICMATIDVDMAYEAMCELLKIDKSWIPAEPGTSLYVRPTMIATEQFLGVHASNSYLFFIILSPVGAYFANGFNPISIFVESEYVRAAPGGIGFSKAGANYAASLLASEKAAENGFSQVLWLDGAERKYIEEVGAMNIFFKIDGKIITPALQGSILPGITRDSIIKLAKDEGYPVEERRISIDEVIEASKSGKLEEVFGTGTAAVVAPVNELSYKGQTLTAGDGNVGPAARKLYDRLTGIQLGRLPDPFGWVTEVK